MVNTENGALLKNIGAQVIANPVQASKDYPGFNLRDSLLSYEELLIADIPDRDYLLPWLPRGGLAMVFARPGIGKTHFAISLAIALASGSKFMCWSTSKKTKVLFMDGEMSLAEIRQRLIRLNPTIPEKQLLFLSHEHFYRACEKDLTVTEKTMQEAILGLLDDEKEIGLLIIDNLSSLSRLKENESDPWREVMNPFLIACRRRGVAVLLVHHSAKTGTPRGTVAREDILDAIIKLERNDEETSELFAKFKVSFTKSRSCCGEDIRPFWAELVQKGEYLAWNISSLEDSTKERLIRLIAEGGEDGVRAKEAAEALGVSEAMISKLKKELSQEGSVNQGVRNAPLFLSEEGRKKYVLN